MDLNEVKNLISNEGERVILVENGEPTVVLMSFGDYKKMAGLNPERQKNLFEAKESQTQKEKAEEAEKVEELKQELNRELTLEDLPF